MPRIITTSLAVIALAGMPFIAGCATIIEGDDQAIDVSSNPTGAACELTRQGERVGVVNPTPGSVFVERSKHDIHVACDKEGYETGQDVLVSGFEGWTVGNIVFGGPIGLVVDASSGAINQYPASVVVTLPPAP